MSKHGTQLVLPEWSGVELAGHAAAAAAAAVHSFSHSFVRLVVRQHGRGPLVGVREHRRLTARGGLLVRHRSLVHEGMGWDGIDWWRGGVDDRGD